MIPGSGRSPGEGKGYPLQYSGLENSMDYIVYRATESRTRLSDFYSLTFVGKVMPLLFNMLSRFVTAFLPWSKHLLISWLQSSSAIILEPKKIKFVTASTFSSSICHEVMRPDAMILVF